MSASQRQEFCVRWNSHLGSLGAAFPQLLAGQRFVDVTLVCEGHQVHCHRLVLAACSSYFESILAENPCKHPVIILPSEIKLWEIQALVDFMYKGEVNVTLNGLPQLLRCAEQLMIRGLYGTDAALNLNQLKAMTAKGMPLGAAEKLAPDNDEETDDTATNSTTTTNTTTTAASALQQLQMAARVMNSTPMTNAQMTKEQILKDVPAHINLNGQQQQQQQQLQQMQLQQEQQKFNSKAHHATNMVAGMPTAVNAAASVGEDSCEEDSTNSNAAYEQYEEPYEQKPLVHMMDTAIDDDHNYIAHEEDDSSFNESANASLMNMSALDSSSASFKRVRRSEASLAEAANCVSKGQTFQNVSNRFNIPVSTIRFYMARKGILPKRKRGRGASNAGVPMNNMAGGVVGGMSPDLMTAEKRSNSPNSQIMDAHYHMLQAAGALGYKHLSDSSSATAQM